MANLQKTIIEIKTGTILKVALIILGLVFLYLIRDVVAIFLFSVVVASAVEPGAAWFNRHRIPWILSVLLVYVISFVILAILFSFIIPPLFNELTSFSSSIPKLINDIAAPGTLLEMIPFDISKALADNIQTFILELKSAIGDIAGGFFQATSSIFGGALSFALIIVVSFYLSVQEKGIENFFRVIVPKEYEEYVVSLWLRSRKKIGGWLQGQILLGVIIGVLVYLGLTILRVKLALSLAILSAIFELIPYFGPVLAAIPAILIAFFQKPVLGFYVLIFFIIIQQFENHLIYPVVIRKAIGVPPIIVILALIIGGKLGGFFGILLAVPIAAVIIEFLNDVAAKKQIGKEV